MASRNISKLLPAVLLPLMAWGQQLDSAAAAEQALRARVTEFLQYHVEGNFRKAYDMVAEDTKEYYFNTGKVQLHGFKINSVSFNDNFTQATVVALLSKTMNVVGQEVPVQAPSTTTWKLENGKWVWHNEVQAAPSGIPFPVPGASGPAPISSAKGNDLADAGLPKELNEKTLADSLKSIMQQVQIDKQEVTLALDKPSEDRVIFHNGMTGSVQLEMTVPEIPGFTATIDKVIVRASTDVPIVFSYKPGQGAPPKEPVNVRVTVQPLNQDFVVIVSFAKPATR